MKKNNNLKSMSVDELWESHESVVAELSHKIAAERAMLEDRLNQLGSIVANSGARSERRPYPKVLPKYRNPENRSETRASRGEHTNNVIDATVQVIAIGDDSIAMLRTAAR